MNYIKITKDNFEEFSENHVSGGWDKTFIGLDIPKNESEFKAFTDAIYGVSLGVECLAYPPQSFNNNDGFKYNCKYKITGMEEREYSKNPIMQLWNKKYGQYDGLKILLNTCFGFLSCGGFATYHYGQTKCDKETWERVKNWDNYNNVKVMQSAIKQQKDIEEILGVNPFR